MKGSEVIFHNGVKLVSVDQQHTEYIDAKSLTFGIYLCEQAHDTIDYFDSDRGIYWSASPGELAFVPPSDAKAEFPGGRISHTRIELSPQIFTAAMDYGSSGRMDIRRFMRDDAMINLVRAMQKANSTPDPLFIDHLSIAIAYRAASWLGVQAVPSGRHFGRIERVIEYINDNIDKPMSLYNLASIASMSEFHFARQFKRATGMSPHKYTLEKRIAKAKRLLAAQKTSIVDIALSCGFSHQAHLSTAFKSRVGVSPSQYRRQLS